MRKITAAALANLILVVSPGLGGYHAMAQVIGPTQAGPNTAGPVPGALPFSSPLDIPASEGLGGIEGLGADSQGSGLESLAAVSAESLISWPDEIRPKSRGEVLPPGVILGNLSDRLQAAEIPEGGNPVRSAFETLRGIPSRTPSERALLAVSPGREGKPEGSGAAQGPRTDETESQKASARFDGSLSRNEASPVLLDGEGYVKRPLTGKTLLLIGSSVSRPFLLGEPARIAREMGFKLILVDTPKRRHLSQGLVPDEDFIPAEVDDHDEANQSAIVDRVSEAVRGKTVDAVLSLLNPYSILAGRLTDRLEAKGNSADSVIAAHTKSIARERLSRLPEVATPFQEVSSPEEARNAFRKIAGDGGRVVLKPKKGGGSALVKVGVSSEEEAARVFEEIDRGLKEFATRSDAGFFQFDQYPGIMMEKQLEGPEVDVELVLQDGKVRFWHVSDNPPMDPPYAVEKGVTFPAQLSRNVQLALAEMAQKAVDALGLKTGNIHLEAIVTPEGPKVLEVNARMGGLFVWEYVKAVTGVNLVEQGIRSLFGLPVEGPKDAPFTLEARLIIPVASGVIESIEGLEEAARMEGIERIRLLKKPGDRILAPPDDTFDYVGYVSGTGKDYAEAFARTQAALEAVTVRIRKADGTIVEQKGSSTHVPVDPNAILEEARRKAAGRDQAGQEKIPKSFWTYLGGVAMYAMGMEAMAILAPIYAYAHAGAGFAILTQAVQIASRIPGSVIGARWVSRFDSRKVYIGGIALMALAFLALPGYQAWAAWKGVEAALLPALFIGYSVVGGLVYGAIRGVAEQEIFPRILGQGNEKLLEKAGSLFFVVVEPAAFMAAFGIGALVKGIGDHWSAALAGGVALLSVLPFMFIRYRSAELKAGEKKGGTEDRLPLKDYFPYVFYVFAHQVMYGLLAPFFAIEVFLDKGFTGSLIGWYDIGSFAIAAALTFAPRLLPKWSEKNWALAGILPVLGFLWASLLVGSPVVSLALAAALGATTTVLQVKWKKIYQNRLKIERQPRVFQWLSISAVAATLVPFALIKGSLALSASVPMMTLLIAVAGGITALAAFLAWTQRPRAVDPEGKGSQGPK